MIDTRVKRFVLGFVVLVALICLGAVAALFLWVNEKAVERTVESFAVTSLNAAVRFEGPVEIKRLSSLKVKLPAMTFVDKETEAPIGRIGGAQADVSLWSLALGAVHVNAIAIEGLEARLSVPALSGNALFDATFGAVKFPSDLRISALSLAHSRLTLDVAAHEKPHRFLLTDLTVTLGRFSPEMTSPFELSSRFEALDEAGNIVAVPQNTEMPVLEPEDAGSATTSNETPAADAVPEAAPDAQQQPSAPAAEGTTESAPEADAAAPMPGYHAPQPSESDQATARAEASGTDAPGTDAAATTSNGSEASDASAPAAAPEAAPVPEKAEGDEQSNPERRAIERHNEGEAPAAEQNNGSSNNDSATSARLDLRALRSLPLVASAHAADAQQPADAGADAAEATAQAERAARAASAEEIFKNFDPSRSAGLISATGTLTISTANRYVMLEDLNFSGEIFYDGVHYTTVAKADVLRFKGEELSGMNAAVTLSRPQQASGDLHFAAVDFRLRPGILESPEMRVVHSITEAGRTTALEIASTVKADFNARTLDCDSFNTRVTVTGDKTLPSDFEASLSGFVRASLARHHAKVGLSGSFAGAPVSYNGEITFADLPRLRGDLMLGDLDTARLPAIRSLDWMHAVDFAGTLRIANITSGAFAATQLRALLTVGEGRTHFDELIVNLADGRLLGTLDVNAAGNWVFDGKIDGVSVDKLMMGLGAAPLVSGVASGTLALAGNRLESAALEASASLSVLRGALWGVDLEAARRVVLKTSQPADITRQGAQSSFDEASAQISLKDQKLTIAGINARSVYVRTTGDVRADLEKGEVAGSLTSTFAPLHGEPSIYLASQVAGSGLAPTWTFDFDRAAKALQRAQGGSLFKTPRAAGKDAAPEKSEPRSIWQSVRDFFKF